MDQLNELRSSLPEEAKDLKLNIQGVLRPEALTEHQAWGCALASACFIKDLDVAAAVAEDAAAAGVPADTLEDARAAAAIMGMNTVYYRFKHMIKAHKDAYENLPAKLRMNRMARVASTKQDFELFSMSCAALAGCELCITMHEQSILAEGGSEAAVHDAVRVAAAVNGFSIALNLGS